MHFISVSSCKRTDFHIAVSPQKETEEKISSKISGTLNMYTQVGLAAGQQYMVSITGEKDGVMGTESTTQFTTCESMQTGLYRAGAAL